MNERLQLISPPQAEPLDLKTVKGHLRVEHDLDDALILSLVASARDYVQRFTGRQLVAAGYRLAFERFPCEIKLPISPALAVSSITYLDTAGVRQTLATSAYTVDTIGEVWTIHPSFGTSWPAYRCDVNSVQVNLVAGYLVPFTASGAAVTFRGLAPVNGTEVRVTNSGGELPQGLSPLTPYYVVGASGSTCGLSLTVDGAAITTTDAGTGLQFVGEMPDTLRSAMLLMVGHWYENREAVVVGTIATPLPMAVDSLLYMNKDWRVG